MKKAQQRKLLNVEIIYDHVDNLQQLPLLQQLVEQ